MIDIIATMEKTENFEPTIKTRGNASTEKQRECKENLTQKFSNNLEALNTGHEVQKTPQQLAVLDFVNEETGKLMKEFGQEPCKIPHENYHLLPSEMYEKIRGRSEDTAAANVYKQGIIFKNERYQNDLLNFGLSAFHESLHLLAQLKLEVNQSKNTDETDTTVYRTGVSVHTLQKDIDRYSQHEHFKGLHEAIVSKSTDKFVKKLLKNPLLKKERRWLESKSFKNLRRKKSLEVGLNEEEIIWINEDGKNFQSISYPIHQRVLQYICEEIQKKFPGKYKSSEKVFEEFQKAHFTGKLFEIARITEKTFGKGSFRSLGDMDEEHGSASRKLEEFKKLRRINND
jgi:hypothetical protein